MLAHPPSRRLRALIYVSAWLAIALALASAAAAASPWLQAATLPYTPAYQAFVTAGSQLYLIGGEIGSGPLNKALVAKVESDGTVKGWSESPYELPQPLAEHAGVLLDRWIYLLGGTNGKTALKTVYSAEIPSTGQIGPWQAGSALLPENLHGHGAVVLGRNIFVFGGSDEGGKVTGQIYRGPVDATGDIQKWERAGSLPQPLTQAAWASTDKLVYVVGGETDKGLTSIAYVGYPTPAGEFVWKDLYSLPRPLSRGVAFVYGKTLFYVGGYDGNGSAPDAYAARIKDDGTINDWIGWLPLSKGVMGLRGTLVNGRVYLSGGFDGARFINSLQFVAIDSSVPTPTPTPVAVSAPIGNPATILPLVLTGAEVVAAVSFLVVVLALVFEKVRPTQDNQ